MVTGARRSLLVALGSGVGLYPLGRSGSSRSMQMDHPVSTFDASITGTVVTFPLLLDGELPRAAPGGRGLLRQGLQGLWGATRGLR